MASLEFAARRRTVVGRSPTAQTRRTCAGHRLRPGRRRHGSGERRSPGVSQVLSDERAFYPLRAPLGGRRPIRVHPRGAAGPGSPRAASCRLLRAEPAMPVRAIVPIAFHNPSNTIDGMLAEITEVEVEACRRAFRTRSTSTSRSSFTRRRYPGGRSPPSRRCDRGHGRRRDGRARRGGLPGAGRGAEEVAEVEATEGVRWRGIDARRGRGSLDRAGTSGEPDAKRE